MNVPANEFQLIDSIRRRVPPHPAVELGIGDDDLVITRNELDDANDRLFEIRLLVADARRDLDDRLAATRVLSRLLDGIDAVIATN